MIEKLIYNNLLTLIDICKKAGKYQILNHLKENKYSSKKNNTPLSDIDLKSNEIISQGIKDLDINNPIISEECFEGITSGDAFWIIDPLDGTRNYLNQGSEFCINICLLYTSDAADE